MDESDRSIAKFEPADTPTPAPGAVEVFCARSPDQIATSHSSLQTLYRYWTLQRGARSMPSRADIDPVDLK